MFFSMDMDVTRVNLSHYHNVSERFDYRAVAKITQLLYEKISNKNGVY